MRWKPFNCASEIHEVTKRSWMNAPASVLLVVSSSYARPFDLHHT